MRDVPNTGGSGQQLAFGSDLRAESPTVSHIDREIDLGLRVADKYDNRTNMFRSKRDENIDRLRVLIVLPQRIREPIPFDGLWR